MKDKNLINTLLIVWIILLLSNIATAVPAAPSPTCGINAEISEVTFREAYFREDNGLPCNSGGINMPATYLLKVKINNVSTVRGDGIQNCAAMYPIDSENTLTILKSSIKDSESFEKNQLIEGEIDFRGDECGSGIYLNNYNIINRGSSKDIDSNDRANNETETTKGESSSFFSRIWSWIKSLFN